MPVIYTNQKASLTGKMAAAGFRRPTTAAQVGRGTITAVNTTFAGNAAQDGNSYDSGSGFGGAMFNLNADHTSTNCIRNYF